VTRFLFLLLPLLLGLRSSAQGVTAEGLQALVLCNDSSCVDSVARSMGLELKFGHSGVGYMSETDTTVYIMLAMIARFSMFFRNEHLMHEMLDGLVRKGWTHGSHEGKAVIYVALRSSRRLYVEGSIVTCSDGPLPFER
jgi:hypothetical protein